MLSGRVASIENLAVTALEGLDVQAFPIALARGAATATHILVVKR